MDGATRRAHGHEKGGRSPRFHEWFPATHRTGAAGGDYAVNELPQPQLPVEFGFLNVKPAPIMVVT